MWSERNNKHVSMEECNSEAKENIHKPKNRYGTKRKRNVDKEESNVKKAKIAKEGKTWTAYDYFTLKEAVQDTLDFTKVVEKLSQKFTIQDITERWRALLYDKDISNEITKSIASMQSAPKLWSSVEDEILSREHSNPHFAGFQPLLDRYRNKFHPSRTAKSLESRFFKLRNDWAIKKHVALNNKVRPEIKPNKNGGENGEVDNQPKFEITMTGTRYVPYSPITTQPPSRTRTFAQFEKQIYATPWTKSEELKPAEKNAVQSRRREYIKQEDQAYSLILPLEQYYEAHKEHSKDQNVIASLYYGNNLYFPIRKQEVVLGKNSGKQEVDIDLSSACQSLRTAKNQESPPDEKKISKKQAVITFETSDCEFYLRNIGKPIIKVSGKTVSTNQKIKLNHRSLIEVCNLKMIFDINNTWLAQTHQTYLGQIRSTLVSYPPTPNTSQPTTSTMTTTPSNNNGTAQPPTTTTTPSSTPTTTTTTSTTTSTALPGGIISSIVSNNTPTISHRPVSSTFPVMVPTTTQYSTSTGSVVPSYTVATTPPTTGNVGPGGMMLFYTQNPTSTTANPQQLNSTLQRAPPPPSTVQVPSAAAVGGLPMTGQSTIGGSEKSASLSSSVGRSVTTSTAT